MIPVVYASQKNSAVAYIWKVKFNEGAKTPAFYNVLPEANHNEMTGFDAKEKTRDLARKFHVILLRDSQDHPKIVRRMEILRDMYETRGVQTSTVPMEGKTALHRMFSSFLVADWAAYELALRNEVDPEQAPMVEEFKKLI